MAKLSDKLTKLDPNIAVDREDQGDQYDMKINDLRRDLVPVIDTLESNGSSILMDGTDPPTTSAGKGYVVGSGNEGLVQAQNQANMSVKVATGGTAYNSLGQKIVFAANLTITVAAADATNARWDIVVVKSDGTVGIRQGTPAGSPADPTLTSGDVVLARVTVDANAANIASNKIADLRSRTVVDGTKLNDGSISLAKIKHFKTIERTGTAGAENIAHGKGVAPSFVAVIVTEAPSAADVDVTEGNHDATNIIVTVSPNTVKYKVLALF